VVENKNARADLPGRLVKSTYTKNQSGVLRQGECQYLIRWRFLCMDTSAQDKASSASPRILEPVLPLVSIPSAAFSMADA